MTLCGSAAIVTAILLTSCGNEPAVLIAEGGGSASCPATLADRLVVTTTDVSANVGYLELGYDGFPKLSRIELSAEPDGASQVAWQPVGRTTIVVTPLDAQQSRRGDDVVIAGLELGGLIAQDDGFAVLTRRPDPGQDISVDPNENGTQAAFLVRYRDGGEAFALDLTGTASPKPSLNYTSALAGQLAWNGTQYGAYFTIHQGKGSPLAGYWTDQLSYADDNGSFLDGGWDSGCSTDDGLRLLADPGTTFSAACLSDRAPQTGLNWMMEGQSQHLAFEEAWSGYTAGRFGAIAPESDGTHLVVWASRGDGGAEAGAGGATSGASHSRAMDAPDLALMHIAGDGSPIGELTWLTSTPGIAEFTVHVAPYGKDRYLLVWSTLDSCTYLNGNCYGHRTGTFARVIDADGNALTADEQLPAWPSDDSPLTVFPNGDVGWAFVNSLPDYTTRLDLTAVPANSTLSVARLRYCE